MLSIDELRKEKIAIKSQGRIPYYTDTGTGDGEANKKAKREAERKANQEAFAKSNEFTSDDYSDFLKNETNYWKSYKDPNAAEVNAQLDKKRNREISEALAGYNRMLKYLPELNKEAGINGLGISESGYIDAMNNRNNLIANAQYNYDANRLAYEQAQEEYRRGQEEKYKDAAAAYQANLAASQKAEKATKYEIITDELLGELQNVTEDEDVEKIIDRASQYLPPEYYNSFLETVQYNKDAGIIDQYINANNNQAAYNEAVKSAYDPSIMIHKDGLPEVGINKHFKLWSGRIGTESSGDINVHIAQIYEGNDPTTTMLNAMADRFPDNQPFVYNDQLFMRIDGVVCRIESDGGWEKWFDKAITKVSPNEKTNEKTNKETDYQTYWQKENSWLGDTSSFRAFSI